MLDVIANSRADKWLIDRADSRRGAAAQSYLGLKLPSARRNSPRAGPAPLVVSAFGRRPRIIPMVADFFSRKPSGALAFFLESL
jgi:hypothetical protein